MDKALPWDSEELNVISDYPAGQMVLYQYRPPFSNLQIEDKTISLLHKRGRTNEKLYKGL